MKKLILSIILLSAILISKEVGIWQPPLCNGKGYTLSEPKPLSDDANITTQDIICNED